MKKNEMMMIVGVLNDEVIFTSKAKNTAEMWREIHKVWPMSEEAVVKVIKGKKLFMKLHLVEKKNGKKWQVNDIPESRRSYKKSVNSVIPKITEKNSAVPDYMLYC